MLSKKIISLLLSVSALAPAASAAVQISDPEYAAAATSFISQDNLQTDVKSSSVCLYGIRPEKNGDVNDDGKTDITDYALLRRYLNSGKSADIEIDLYNADVNYDGEVNIYDLETLKDRLYYK